MAFGLEKLSTTVKRKIRKQMNISFDVHVKVASCTYKGGNDPASQTHGFLDTIGLYGFRV